MKKYGMILAALLLAVVIAQPALVCGAATTAESVKEVTGEVVSVDSASSTVVLNCVIDAAPAQITLAANESTKIEIGADAANLSDVAVGDKVSCVYSAGAEGKNTIVSMVVSQ